MPKFLLDANFSFLTALYLRKHKIDAIHLREVGKIGLSDAEVIFLAKKLKRIVITFDLDFGEIYFLKKLASFGVVILRLRDQTVETVNKVLLNFFRSKEAKKLGNHTLAVISESSIRVFKPKEQ